MAERIIDISSEITPDKIAFIDLEASGLGSKSWPVEVGWAFADSEPESMLILPHPSWPDDAWDENAEKLHGIPLTELRKNGMPARDVCLALNEALEGAMVYSDAPDWDGFWLFRLFSAAGVRQSFMLQDYGALVRRLGVTGDHELFARAARLAPRRHRAAADARHLQTLYRLAGENCGPRLTR